MSCRGVQSVGIQPGCRHAALSSTVPLCTYNHLLHTSSVHNICRFARAAGVGAASLALAASAQAVTVKLGATGGALVFDPATVTIKAGESVTWQNNVGFPHNVVFDEDAIPVSGHGCQLLSLGPCMQSCRQADQGKKTCVQ